MQSAILDLEGIGDKWNISLFHYRNYGNAYGRVFIGIQSPDEELDSLYNYFKCRIVLCKYFNITV